jgi:hypothetical protein
VLLERLCGGVFVGGGWLVVVGILLYVLFEGVCHGSVGVRGGLGWTCVYGVCC